MTVLLLITIYLVGLVTGIFAYKISVNPTPKDLQNNADVAVKKLLKNKNIKVK